LDNRKHKSIITHALSFSASVGKKLLKEKREFQSEHWGGLLYWQNASSLALTFRSKMYAEIRELTTPEHFKRPRSAFEELRRLMVPLPPILPDRMFQVWKENITIYSNPKNLIVQKSTMGPGPCSLRFYDPPTPHVTGLCIKTNETVVQQGENKIYLRPDDSRWSMSKSHILAFLFTSNLYESFYPHGFPNPLPQPWQCPIPPFYSPDYLSKCGVESLTHLARASCVRIGGYDVTVVAIVIGLKLDGSFWGAAFDFTHAARFGKAIYHVHKNGPPMTDWITYLVARKLNRPVVSKNDIFTAVFIVRADNRRVIRSEYFVSDPLSFLCTKYGLKESDIYDRPRSSAPTPYTVTTPAAAAAATVRTAPPAAVATVRTAASTCTPIVPFTVRTAPAAAAATVRTAASTCTPLVASTAPCPTPSSSAAATTCKPVMDDIEDMDEPPRKKSCYEAGKQIGKEHPTQESFLELSLLEPKIEIIEVKTEPIETDPIKISDD